MPLTQTDEDPLPESSAKELQAMRKENRQLRELVIQLSKLVIQNVVTENKTKSLRR